MLKCRSEFLFLPCIQYIVVVSLIISNVTSVCTYKKQLGGKKEELQDECQVLTQVGLAVFEMEEFLENVLCKSFLWASFECNYNRSVTVLFQMSLRDLWKTNTEYAWNKSVSRHLKGAFSPLNLTQLDWDHQTAWANISLPQFRDARQMCSQFQWIKSISHFSIQTEAWYALWQL